MTLSLLIASTNPGKLREIQAILDGLQPQHNAAFRLLLPAEMGLQLEVVENGSTYAENAALKARAYSQASGLVTLADDSGLEVDALDGAPGLYSARYAPWAGATDADRRQYLLGNLAGRPRPWTARFRCAIAIATPVGALYHFEGLCPGEVIPEERGTGGFGYDPIFLLPHLGKTMAELPEEEKNRLSHRALAVWSAMPLLETLVDSCL